jgi:imidazolonepropionase-like amidohydrolase
VSDAGITIIPGTDALPGYSLHHELELYVRAGIPAPEVLRMATLTPSQVIGVTKDLGIISAGKLADMILIDGDPAKNIRDTRNITTVIKGGKVFDPLPLRKRWGSSLVRHDRSIHLSLPPSYFLIPTFN